MKQTKKSLLFSGLALVLSVSMLIGSTFAWFTDSVTSFANKIQSGTLKVDLELLDKETGEWNSLKATQAPIFDYDKWEPGYVDTKILKVENEGNLALKWVAKFYSEKQLSILADVIDVYVRPSESEIGYPANRSLEGYTCVGSLKTFINSIEETTQGTLEAKEAAYLGIALKMREEAGNEYQNLSLGGAFDIRIFATQHTSESDSFGNQYDKNSLFEDFVDKSILTSQGKYLNDGADSVNFSIYHKGVKIVAASVPASAIANKDKPVTITIRAIDSYIEAGENTQSFAYDIDVTNLKSNLKGDQLVTVVIAAPKGLASIKAYHKNELLTDAVYDEVEGTITFKTASFSPFAVAADIVTVETFEALQAAMQNNGANIALGKDIKVESIPRDKEHAYPNSDNPKYYNGIKVKGKNVSLDLNGKGITVSCGQGYNDHNDVGALFFVAEEGSLNINDSVGTGYIKMESSIYAVWAPFNDGESYLDINGGIFIADSYAGDPVGTPTDSNGNYDPVNGTMTNAQEGANRALIYAGHGGNINVYGGYFLYNNTLNDNSNRNNGAFNAKDYYEDGALITIHEGVYLSNKYYRQNPYRNPDTKPSFDDYSIKLEGEDEKLAEIAQVTLDTPITIDGKQYGTWYQVQRKFYNLTFIDNDGNKLDTMKIPFGTAVNVDAKDDVARGKLTGVDATDFEYWVNAASVKVTDIGANNTNHVVLYPKLKEKCTVRWLDQNGNVINFAVVEKDTKYKNWSKELQDFKADNFGNMEFHHWEIREVVSNDKVSYKEVTGDYTITKDITLYPYYVYKGGLGLTPHDEDGDGRPEYYTVEAVAGLKGENGKIEIPGDVNDVPVTVITDISSDWNNANISTVIIKDGVVEIASKAFAMTSGLKTIEIPASVTSIGSNAFADTIGGALISKTITIKFAGTWAQWQAACGGANKDNNWDSGLGGGSKVICTDATYVLDAGYLDGRHTWNDWKKQ